MKQAVLLILLAVVMGCNERTNEQITHIKPQFINASDFEFIEMMRQSPINIDAESAQSVHHSNITFNYPHDLELKVINTGSPGE
ncbi:MAG TPA: hypothetical protein DEQ34_12805, partial [Balneolaceae bacterium]|nr:hypothetical protein [Balneolaceae bacterium]